MKTLNLIVLMFIFGSFGFAQQLQPIAISNGGGNMSNGSVKLTCTIGQPVTGMVSNNTAKVTQGFQNTFLVMPDGISEWAQKNLNIEIYPVPAKNQVTVAIAGNISEDVLIVVFDLNGKFLSQIPYQKFTPEVAIDLTGFLPGVYIFKIKSVNGMQLASYKIVKNN